MGKGKDSLQELPVKVLGQGVPHRLITPVLITQQTRAALKDHPEGFIGALTTETLAAVSHQIQVLECGFLPGVSAEIISKGDDHRLHLNGSAQKLGVTLEDEVTLVLANMSGGGIRLVEFEGLPWGLRLISSRINGLLEGGMRRMVGVPVRRVVIGPEHVTAEVGVTGNAAQRRRTA